MFISCTDLNLNPLSSPTSDSWYTTENEVIMSLNDFYKIEFFSKDDESWTDNFTKRSEQSDLIAGTLTSQNGTVSTFWLNKYKMIARANNIINNADKLLSNGISSEKVNMFVAEARFFRGCAYLYLISKFGDVPFTDKTLSIDEAFKVGRTDKDIVKEKAYEDLDFAIEELPVSYSGIQRVTKGAALAMKARFSLYNNDYVLARNAAKSCIDLDKYKLHPDFSDLFLQTTKNSKEMILGFGRSLELGIVSGIAIRDIISRNSGGYAYVTPSWDLFASFLCTDGLPIDESPLFDPHNPFKNRDPRCSATIVPFGSEHLGFIYDPSPLAITVKKISTGEMIKNMDTRANQQYASFNGLLWKKGIDESWLENGMKIEPDEIVIRYAEVLLIYAEAKIELDEIDASVLDAMNMVRARAYGVSKDDINDYPQITETNQESLRRILRVERRMEFANEGLRYMDLVRWKIADKALTTKDYGLLYPLNSDNMDDWFWPSKPEIDDDGVADFSKMEDCPNIQILSIRNWVNRQYLWPIPFVEISTNENISQNEGY